MSIKLYHKGQTFSAHDAETNAEPPPAPPGRWIDSKVKAAGDYEVIWSLATIGQLGDESQSNSRRGVPNALADGAQGGARASRTSRASRASRASTGTGRSPTPEGLRSERRQLLERTQSMVRASELADCGFYFIRGLRNNFCGTPAGDFRLSVDADEWRWRAKSRNIVPENYETMVYVCVPFFYLSRIVNDVLWTMSVGFAAASRPDGDSHVSRTLMDVHTGFIHPILVPVSLFILTLSRFVPCTELGRHNLHLLRSRRLPMPIFSSGKLEIVALLAVLLYNEASVTATPWVSTEGNDIGRQANLVLRTFGDVFIFFSFACEILLALISAVGSALYHRNWRLLFQFCSAKLERDHYFA